jgi:5'-nucleotidase
MWLNGTPIDLKASYNVTVNSFLAAGGDNFFELANGANKNDTGMTDLQGMVDYMAAMTKSAPLAVDNAQRAVGVVFPAGAPATYAPGDTVKFSLSSLAFPAPSGSTLPQDTTVAVKLGDTVLGTFPVANTSSADPDDETGTASVSVVLPTSLAAGVTQLTIVGTTTGTEMPLQITVEAVLATTGVDVTAPAAIAALLLVLGGAFVVVGRRRKVAAVTTEQ